MLQISNNFDEEEDTQFPAFPVIFQQELEQQGNAQSININSRVLTGLFKLPEKQIKELLLLIDKMHQTLYPQFFKQTWENGSHNIDNFFSIYRPLNQKFVEEMKQKKQNIKIVRISSHKIYVGEFIDKNCTGKSILIFKNGNIYEGNMANNKRQQKGIYVQRGVGWYEGNFKNDLKDDEGIEVAYKKWAYKGNFVNGLRHQKGLFVDKNDIIYSGQWKLGIMHGKGTLKTSNSIYHGMLVNSLKHGNGSQRFLNGDTYKGEYQNNRFDGYGTYSWKKDQGIYEGSFKNGLRHGKGKWSSGQTKYSGNYSQGLKQGFGELYFPSGNFYKGNFVEDKRQNYGEMFWTDGSFYKGDWKGGIQNGKGQIYLVGGEVISGLFQNSILVQITPSIYQKQMEISSMGIQDLFGSNSKLQTQNKNRTFSESKNIGVTKKKLARIQQNSKKKNSIKNNIYFKSPEKADNQNNNTRAGLTGMPSGIGNFAVNRHSIHARQVSHQHQDGHGKSSDGRECKCIKRLQNFRLRQRIKTKMNQSKVDNTINNDN